MSHTTPAEPGVETTETSVEQALTGCAVGTGERAVCACGKHLGEGSWCLVRAHRFGDEPALRPVRLFCELCAGDDDRSRILHPTTGADEIVAEAHLAVRSDVASRSHCLVIVAETVCAHSPPTDGADPASTGGNNIGTHGP